MPNNQCSYMGMRVIKRVYFFSQGSCMETVQENEEECGKV